MCEIVVEKILANASHLFVSGTVVPTSGGVCTSVRVSVGNESGTFAANSTVSVPSTRRWDVTLNLANYPELGDRANPCFGAPLNLGVTCADNKECRWTKQPDEILPRCCPTVQVESAEGLPDCEIADDRLQRPLKVTWRVVRSDNASGIALGYLGDIAATVTIRDTANRDVLKTLTRTYSGEADDYLDSATFVLPAGRYNWRVELDDHAGCSKESHDGTVELAPCSCANQPRIEGRLTVRRPGDSSGAPDVDVTDAVFRGECIAAESVTVELPTGLLNAGLPTRWESPAFTDPPNAARAVRARVELPAAAADATTPTETRVRVTVGFPPCDQPIEAVVRRCPPKKDPPPPPERRPGWLGTVCDGVDCRWTLGAWKFLFALFLVAFYLGINFFFDYQIRADLNQKLSEMTIAASQAASKAATAAAQAAGVSGALAYGVGLAVTEPIAQVASGVSEAAGNTLTSGATVVRVISFVQQMLAYFGMFLLICSAVFLIFSAFFFFVWLSCCWRRDFCLLFANIAWTVKWGLFGTGLGGLLVGAIHLLFMVDPASRMLSPILGSMLLALFGCYVGLLTLFSFGLEWVLSRAGCTTVPVDSWPSEGGYE